MINYATYLSKVLKCWLYSWKKINLTSKISNFMIFCWERRKCQQIVTQRMHRNWIIIIKECITYWIISIESMIIRPGRYKSGHTTNIRYTYSTWKKIRFLLTLFSTLWIMWPILKSWSLLLNHRSSSTYYHLRGS